MAYIQSITLLVPACFVYRNAKYLNWLFKKQNWRTYLQHGYSSLILIDTSRYNPCYPLLMQIVPFLCYLRNCGILSLVLALPHINLYEIKLRFDIEIPGGIFCKTSGFRKVNDVTYLSSDYRKKMREEGSKGIQHSFITVIQYEQGSTIILSFSGKYIEHISLQFLLIPYNDLIQRLCSFGSIYLTHATNPGEFKIARGYVPFLSGEFKSMLRNANWFNNKYKKVNVTKNFLGGAFL